MADGQKKEEKKGSDTFLQLHSLQHTLHPATA